MRQIAVKQRNDAVRCRCQEHPAQDDAADGAGADDDIRQPVCPDMMRGIEKTMTTNRLAAKAFLPK